MLAFCEALWYLNFKKKTAILTREVFDQFTYIIIVANG